MRANGMHAPGAVQVTDFMWNRAGRGARRVRRDVAAGPDDGSRSGADPASKRFQIQWIEPPAAVRSSAAGCCVALIPLLLVGCAVTTPVQIHQLPSPSDEERYCAWYGDVRDGVLYFGQAPFWSAMRRAGETPEADLELAGPQHIGRFDLDERELLASLDVTREGARSGVWDVLPHPNGRIYFTTFYESAGSIDPATGKIERFDGLGSGLNELSLGPEDAIVATRYGGYSESGGRSEDPAASGSLVLFSPDGLLLAEYPLRAPAGYTLAPKTAAWDEVSGRYWLSTDLVRRDPNAPPAPSEHPAIVLDARGSEIARIGSVELHFARFRSNGRGVAAFVADGELRWVEIGPGEPRWQLREGAGKLLDANFPKLFDFVQDIAFGPGGAVIMTRWSGLIHVLGPGEDERRALQLPREDPAGLYYSAGLSGDDVCATFCADVAVVCAGLP